ncbi:MAG: hypothetical protein LUG16_02425 [Candidatus Gastranaerophilales bacterium]|nr:hypothetical protein [Candidatus Gastranaerophilales bacterium]
MTDKDVLELLNMFTTAVQIAKSRNKYEYNINLNEAMLNELFKKAFPSMQNDINRQSIIKKILSQN